MKNALYLINQSLSLAAHLAFLQDGLHRQQFHSADCSAFFHIVRIRNRHTKHLIAATDSKHRSRLRRLLDCSLKPILPHPFEIAHRILASRQADHIGMVQLSDRSHVAHRHLRHLLKHIEIREIRDARITDDRNINKSFRLLVEALRQRILIFQGKLPIRNHTHNLHAASFLQHRNTRIKDRLITTKLINNQSLHTRLFLIGQKHQSPEKLRKHAAPVNVSNQKHRCVDHLCHPHVDDVIFFQIDFRGTARTFDHDDVCVFLQLAKRPLDIRNQLLLVCKIVTRTHVTEHFTVHDHLRSNIVGRLKEDWIHADHRCNASRLRLHHLRSSHLKPFTCNIGIECHIL